MADARPSMADAGSSMAGERPFFLDARPSMTNEPALSPMRVLTSLMRLHLSPPRLLK